MCDVRSLKKDDSAKVKKPTFIVHPRIDPYYTVEKRLAASEQSTGATLCCCTPPHAVLLIGILDDGAGLGGKPEPPTLVDPVFVVLACAYSKVGSIENEKRL